MILTGDYHTHTTYSHGTGTVLENAEAAKKIGLKQIAISDHGFSHPAFGLQVRNVPNLIADCREATEKTGVDVFVSMESNILSMDGRIDLTPKFYKDFDMMIAGFHVFVVWPIKDWFKLFWPNKFYDAIKSDASERVRKKTTESYINTIKNNPLDFLTHINFGFFSNAVEVAKCARDYGTYIELNAKKKHITDEELYEMAATGVKFILSSDAHSPDRVGEISLVEDLLKRVPINRDQIVNIDGKVPSFRFAEYKKRHC